MSWVRFEVHEYIWLSLKSIVNYSSFAMLSIVITATSRTGQRILLAAERLILDCALRTAWEVPLSLKFRSETGSFFGYFEDTKSARGLQWVCNEFAKGLQWVCKGVRGFWSAMRRPRHFFGWFSRGFWKQLGLKTGAKSGLCGDLKN